MLSVSQKRVTPSAHLFSLAGSLTENEADSLGLKLEEAVDEGARVLVLDISQLLVEPEALPGLLLASDRVEMVGARILLAARRPSDDFVVGPLERDTVARLATVRSPLTPPTAT